LSTLVGPIRVFNWRPVAVLIGVVFSDFSTALTCRLCIQHHKTQTQYAYRTAEAATTTLALHSTRVQTYAESAMQTTHVGLYIYI